ncbi:MAG TPA: hypothetical protein VJB61_05265 [Actinomycetota bacterium]
MGAAVAASAPWYSSGPDRLTTPATGGVISAAASIAAVPPMVSILERRGRAR